MASVLATGSGRLVTPRLWPAIGCPSCQRVVGPKQAIRITARVGEPLTTPRNLCFGPTGVCAAARAATGPSAKMTTTATPNRRTITTPFYGEMPTLRCLRPRPQHQLANRTMRAGNESQRRRQLVDIAHGDRGSVDSVAAEHGRLPYLERQTVIVVSDGEAAEHAPLYA